MANTRRMNEFKVQDNEIKANQSVLEPDEGIIWAPNGESRGQLKYNVP